MLDRLPVHVTRFGSRGRASRRRWLVSLGAWVLAAGIACGVSAVPTATQPPATAAPPLTPAGTISAQPTANTNPTVSGAGHTATPPPEPPASEPQAATLVIPSVTVRIPPVRVPMVDTSIHSVPLGKILFDTFGGFPRALPLDRASKGQILDFKDVIVPIASPVYGDSDDLSWLEDGDLVMGYVSGEKAFAYPINVLNLHEIVNDEIDGVPLLVTYCPLCFSGVVYHRELDGRLLTFGNTSALYQSDLVMYDHQTGSYWFQVAGEAVVGTLTGSRLKLLPSTTMFWGEWKRLYPETRLLTGTAQSPRAFDGGRYRRGFPGNFQDQINKGRFIFPVDEEKLDDRLDKGEIVLTVEVGDAATAFPLGIIGDGAVNHQVGGQPVVVFARAGSRAVGAFSPVVDGRRLTFDYREDTESFFDRETGTRWDEAGRGVSGSLAGAQLPRLDTRRAFWFSIAIALPKVEVYLP